MDIIKELKHSKNQLLESEADGVQLWRNLKHNKSDLETFLNFNVAEITFKKSNGQSSTVVCTSNTSLVKVMSLKRKKDKDRASKLKSDGIRTHDATSVTTWDIVNNKMKTIKLSSWQIMNFVSISAKNILILDEILNDILKRGDRQDSSETDNRNHSKK